MDENDPLYQDTYQGFITGYSNGADALWDLLYGAFMVLVWLPVWIIVQTVKWFTRDRA